MSLRIKELRKEKKMTIEELSVKSGVSRRAISGYEAGESDITLTKLQDIAKALDVPMYKLISGNYSDVEAEAEKQFQEWKSLVYGEVDKRGDLVFQAKYIDVLEQLIEAKNEIERMKNELSRK